MTTTRINLRDLNETQLEEGKLEAANDKFELYSGRSVIDVARGGTRQLKTNCWVLKWKNSDRQTYWHGKNQEHAAKAMFKLLTAG